MCKGKIEKAISALKRRKGRKAQNAEKTKTRSKRAETDKAFPER